MHDVVIADDAAGAVWELFLQHEVGLNQDALRDGSALDLGTGCGPSFELNRLFVHGHRDGPLVIVRLCRDFWIAGLSD